MSKRRIEMLDIKHLLRLKQKGRSNRKIGETLGIHRNTINTYINQFKATGKNCSELLKLPDPELLALVSPPDVELSSRYKYLLEKFSDYERGTEESRCDNAGIMGTVLWGGGTTLWLYPISQALQILPEAKAGQPSLGA